MKTIQFKKLVPGAKIPAFASSGSSGADVCSVEELTILPGDRAAVPTGLQVDIPEDMEIQVRPRSGLALKQGVTVLNAPGTIDRDFLGEVKIILINLGKVPFNISVGDRIAQLVAADVPRVRIVETETIDKTTARGSGGFGSTGK